MSGHAGQPTANSKSSEYVSSSQSFTENAYHQFSILGLWLTKHTRTCTQTHSVVTTVFRVHRG